MPRERGAPLAHETRAGVASGVFADDLRFLNADLHQGTRPSTSVSRDEWERMEQRVRRAIRTRDDFVTIPFPRIASLSDGPVAAAVAGYRQEAAVVDARLSREVTLAVKATALSDLCEQLCKGTGIRLEAGRSVADEKVTVFCEKMPLRDVMRQLARPFGYTWLRSATLDARRSTLDSGKGSRPVGSESSVERRASSVTPEYRYELVQDLRSQLLEDELRNRGRDAALLDLEREVERYRPYLSLTPDEALARSRTARPAEKKLLEKLAGPGWGMLHLYFQLSPRELAALRTGQKLKFSAEPGPGEQPLPGDVARGVLQSLRDVRLIRYDDGFRISRGDATAPGGLVASSAPEARATVTLALPQSELGQFALDGTAGVFTRSDLPRNSRMSTSDGPLAFGRSALAPGQQNGAANGRLAHDPALTAQVAVQPVPSCHPAPDAGAASANQPAPKVTSADVLEALHRATGIPIVADYYTRLYVPAEVSLRSRRLFEALNQMCEAMRLRWDKEGDWLQFRGATFYDDRLKEVPNRLLVRWAAARQKQGSLPMDALVEIAQLSDAQLDAVSMAEGARHCSGLVEWDLARSRALRPHLRYLAGFTAAQRQELTSAAGLPFARMPLPQQQQYMALALGAEPLQSLEELAGATVRVEYTQPGEFEWRVPGPNWLRFVVPLERGKEGRRQIMLPVQAKTREAVLAAARRLEPSVRDAMLQESRRRRDAVPDAPQMEPDASQISPTRLELRVVYIPGLSNRHPIHVVEPGADYFNTTW
jgi:hypothetical protein